MKYFNLNKLALMLFAVVAFTACKKTETVEPLGTSGQNIVGFIQYGSLDNFANSSLSFDNTLPLDSIEMRMQYSGPEVFSNDVVVTIAPDSAALVAYNATVPSGGIKYKLLPKSLFALKSSTAIIKAGNSISEVFYVHFYPDQLDLAISYMLPLKVTKIEGASGKAAIAPATSIAYLHIIGNPLAGSYTAEGYLYHPSLPRSFTRTGSSAFLTPVSDKALVTELGDLGSSGYYAVLSVADPYATSIQAVTVSVFSGSISPVYQWNSGLPDTNPGYTAAWTKSTLCNNTYNPATKTFYLRYGYLGATGYRVTEEVIKKN